MKGEVRNILKVACIYMATIIGAGFASGQEIVQFFSHYYEGGFYGILLAGLLFSILGYLVLDKVYTERIRNYDEFIFPALGWFAGWVVEIAATLFMLCLFCIMIAGSGNVLAAKLGIPFSSAVLVMSLVCLVFILTNIRGIITLSTFVTPILITGIILVGLYIITCRDVTVFNLSDVYTVVTRNWVFSALIYVSYNSILSIVVMTSLLPYLKTRRTGKMGGILGGAMLCFIALILNTAISFFYPASAASELPVLSLVGKYNQLLGSIYALLLWVAMLVSAVTSGYCFVDRVCSKVRVDKRAIACIACALVIPLSNIGFSGLIASLYPIFGYIGLFVVFAILLQGARPVLSRAFSRRR